MSKGWKSQIAKITGTNPKVDRKILRIKKSWDEVAGILNKGTKKKKKK